MTACPTLTKTIPEDRRMQAQRDIVDLIAKLHRAAESLGKKMVGLQSPDLKVQRRYLGAFHKFYTAGFHGSPELMEIEARLRGMSFDELSDEYTRREQQRAAQRQKWEDAKNNAEDNWAERHGFTREQAEAILSGIPEPGTGRPQLNVIDGGLS